MTRAIAYTRVSTQEQSDSGAGLAAQSSAIRAEMMRRGWNTDGRESHRLFTDTCSGSMPWEGREGLSAAIAMLERHEADVLVCAKLDRLSRSMLDLASLLERSRRKGWQIVLLDFGLDTSTPVGEMVAHILGAVAQFERRRIGERTKEALASKKAAGVKIGRPSTVDPLIVYAALRMRSEQMSYQAIADHFAEMGYPTPQGGKKWRDTSVRAIVRAHRYTLA